MRSITEEKIVNAIKYFVKNTNNIGLTKLFKLLYFLDFMYFKEHNLSITLYDYYAYDFGPVPEELYRSIKKNILPDFLKNEVGFILDKDLESDDLFPKYRIILKNKKIDLEWFSPYEKEMLERVVEIFRDADARTMTEVSHLKNQPWDRTYNVQKKEHGIINYNLAQNENSVDSDNNQEYLKLQKELRTDGRV